MKCLKMIALFAIAGLSASSANAALLFSDDFNSYAVVYGATSLGATWTVPANSVDVYQSSTLETGVGGFAPAFIASTVGNGRFIDLGGTDNDGDSRGTLQSVASFSGLGKQLTFDLAGNNRFNNGSSDSITVSLGSFSTVINPIWTQGFTNYAFFIPDSASGNLVFTMTAGAPVSGNFDAKIGPLLDNVVLNGDVPVPPVPEPSMAMIALGLAGLFAVKRRKLFK